MPFTFDGNNKQINEQANAIGLNQYPYLNRLHVIYIVQVLVIHNCVVIIINVPVVVVVIIIYDCVCMCVWWKIGWTDDNQWPMQRKLFGFLTKRIRRVSRLLTWGTLIFLCLYRCTIKSEQWCAIGYANRKITHIEIVKMYALCRNSV